ncbi:hypothetical protein Droror1_Dr00004490 [Drosera rotundifolia]
MPMSTKSKLTNPIPISNLIKINHKRPSHSQPTSIHSPATSHQILISDPNLPQFTPLLDQRPPPPLLKQIHAQIITQSISSHPSLISSLIHCYLHCRITNQASILFDRYPIGPPPTLLWNLMIRAHSKIPNSEKPINYFARMLGFGRAGFGVFPDEYTYTFLVTSCSHRYSSLLGEIVHGLAVKDGFDLGLFVGNSLINMYCVYGDLHSGQKVLDGMPVRDVFSWTSLLGGYTKQGEVDKAFEVFGKMPVRNDVSWAVMIAGLVAKEKYIEALDCFRAILSDEEVKPNEAVIVCALSACAHLGALDQGNWIRVFLDRNRIPESPNICTALIDMYTKCGRVECAMKLFNSISVKDVHNFTSIISGLAVNALGQEALQVFSQMLAENIKPNEITILGVLNGCSHSGLLVEGTSIFDDMQRLWGIEPSIEHYGCHIDMLARAGYPEKAFGVVKTMPMEPDIVIWRALLNGCRMHHNTSLADQIIHHVWQLEPSCHKNGQVLLSNLYASLGNWEGVAKVRKPMSKRTDTLDLGCSWIEVDGDVREFLVDDNLYPQISKILVKLHEVLKKAKLRSLGFWDDGCHI